MNVKKLLKIIGIILLILVVLIIGFLVLAAFIPAVPNSYTKEVNAGEDIEAKYLAMGEYKVKNMKSEGTVLTKHIYVYIDQSRKLISL